VFGRATIRLGIGPHSSSTSAPVKSRRLDAAAEWHRFNHCAVSNICVRLEAYSIGSYKRTSDRTCVRLSVRRTQLHDQTDEITNHFSICLALLSFTLVKKVLTLFSYVVWPPSAMKFGAMMAIGP